MRITKLLACTRLKLNVDELLPEYREPKAAAWLDYPFKVPPALDLGTVGQTLAVTTGWPAAS